MNYQGEVLYDFDRDEKPADRILTAQAAAYMNQMMTKIPYIGTARRAALDHGIDTAGKTGTTQAYRDAQGKARHRRDHADGKGDGRGNASAQGRDHSARPGAERIHPELTQKGRIP